MDTNVETHLAAFKRGCVDLIDEKQLRKILEKSIAESKPLRVKFGMDPSSPDLHVGHGVPLMKLRDLQQLGHQIVLIVGDSTAMVGDPSGRNKLRPVLTREQVEANLLTYTDQASRVLDMTKTEVRRNSEWFDKMDFYDVLKLAGRMTVARMIERDTFQKRMTDQEPIGIHEFLYPLMQGWDSVEVRSDLELGGTDQLFNLLVGRNLQEQSEQRPQVCFTTPLINGLDGRKMSKSYGNSIGLADEANDMFGKVMSIADDVMESWFLLITRVPESEITEILSGHPREAKARLAHEITKFYNGEDAANTAREAFDSQFRDRNIPADIPEVSWPVEADELALPNLLKELGLTKTTSDARRMIQQGGVRLDGEVNKDSRAMIAKPSSELLVQAGKRRFAKIVS
ncbi:MAG: tyrosyl-tRNA synthetase [Planctomycetota bacterium]|jgi:tyrosyl-tRNA synthetase